MKNIHILPTDKPSRLYYYYSHLGLARNFVKKNDGVNPQHIYITSSDEEIKEGDWFYNSINNTVYQKQLDEISFAYVYKIILTTDQNLIADGVQAIDDEFLEWFVKNPSCEYVDQKLVWEAQKLTSIYKIIIPQEEPKQELHICKYCGVETTQPDDECYAKPKQETLEEAAEIAYQFEADPNFPDETEHKNFVRIFKKGAKWQAEKMYSEEDMRNAFDSAREFNSLDGVVNVHIVLPMGGDMSDLQPLHFTFKEWFEQFKKK